MKKKATEGNFTISIKGDSPYDVEEEMKSYLNGKKALRFLWEWEQFMRTEVKYKDNELYEKVREKYFEMKQEFGVKEEY
jgi:hypothetical protein